MSDDEGNKENTGSTAVQADKKRKPGAPEQKQPEVKKTKLGVEAKPKRMPLGEKRQPEAGLKMKSKPEGNPLKRVASKKDVDVEKTSAKPESKAEVLEQEKQVKVENKPEPEPVSRPANKALPIRAKANISKAADEEIANIPDKLRGYVVQEANTEVLQHVVKNSNTRCAEIKALIAARRAKKASSAGPVQGLTNEIKALNVEGKFMLALGKLSELQLSKVENPEEVEHTKMANAD